MNIHKLKLMAAGTTRLHNMDPFSAGMAGQRAPMMAEGPSAAAVPPQNVMPSAPNTIIPSTNTNQDPNRGTSFAQPAQDPAQQGQEGLSPIDKIYQQIYTQSNGSQSQGPQSQAPSSQPQGGGQQQQPQSPQEAQALNLMNLPFDNIYKAASSVDFTQNLPEATLEKLTVDPTTGQFKDFMGGILEMMQHVGANAYSHSLVGNGKVVGTAMDQRFNSLNTQLPNIVNRATVASAVQDKGYHRSLAPIVTNAANELLKNNPNATPDEVTSMVDQLVESLGSHLQQRYTPQDAQQQQSAGGSIFDF